MELTRGEKLAVIATKIFCLLDEVERVSISPDIMFAVSRIHEGAFDLSRFAGKMVAEENNKAVK